MLRYLFPLPSPSSISHSVFEGAPQSFVIAILTRIQAPSIVFISGELPICSNSGILSFFNHRSVHLLACEGASSC